MENCSLHLMEPEFGRCIAYLAHPWIYSWISCTSVDTFLDILRFEEVEIFGQFHVVSYSIVRLPGVCGNRSRLQASQYVSSLLKKWVRSQEAFIISIWILWTGCRQGYAFHGSVDVTKQKLAHIKREPDLPQATLRCDQRETFVRSTRFAQPRVKQKCSLGFFKNC